MSIPIVTVIMGVFNNEKTLEESLQSLINQSFTHWELIICDDGSLDSTFDIAKGYSERYSNIILISNVVNQGLNYTLNRCLEYAKGKYIARMDGDDISLPNRFEKEVEFLDNHPDIAIVSSPMIYFDESGEWGTGTALEAPSKYDYIKGTPFAHAPCMVRREAYEAVNGYTVDKKLLRVEDYHLWIKMLSKGYKGWNLQEPLYKMRDDKRAAGRRSFKGRLNETYVKYLAFKLLHLPLWYSFFILRPIAVGILPSKLYIYLHKKRMGKQ